MSCGEWWWWWGGGGGGKYAGWGGFTGFGFSLVLGAFLVSTVVLVVQPLKIGARFAAFMLKIMPA